MPAANDILKVTVKGLDRTIAHLKKAGADNDKALNTAIKIEAFRLARLLKKDIRSGAPGGRSLAPLSYIARRKDRSVKTGGGTTVRQNPNRKPLARMAMGVRYRVQSKNPFAMSVGFVAPPGKKMDSKQGTWAFLARKHARGFSQTIDGNLREDIVRKGGVLGKISGGSTPFFLKRSTRTFKTPARPLVEPFWQANQASVNQHIRRNFKLKLKGQRI